jgi:hypothetical protein
VDLIDPAGSHATLRWRKPDSNYRSPDRGLCTLIASSTKTDSRRTKTELVGSLRTADQNL